MALFSVFVSIVFVVRNQSDKLEEILRDAGNLLSTLVSNYEIIIVDNASGDDSIITLKNLTRDNNLPNLQVYGLTKEVDTDTASWVGLENALGDFVVVIDPLTDNITYLPNMLDKSVSGYDVVFARNHQRPAQSLAYRSANMCFNYIYKFFSGINLAHDAPNFRILSKRVINFILQHSQPSLMYRSLPATGGFSKAYLSYDAKPKVSLNKNLWAGIDLGMRLIVSTTKAPMRMVTFLSLFGAIANLLYSFYVVLIALFKDDVAPGWISLSLQHSGMLFLISMVLLVLCEYVLQMISLTSEKPLYHIGQEFMSARITRREKLNIEEAAPDPLSVSFSKSNQTIV